MEHTVGSEQDGRQGGLLSSPVTTDPSVQISANRREINGRFAHLTFDVQTGGRPYFEVLLTTDRTLFDPVNAANRTASNFFSSSDDNHPLIPAVESTAKYLVPPDVLVRFADAEPRPAAIFFTMIVYSDAEGGNPVFAHSPERLAQEAPSVAIRADFTGHAVTRALGVALEKLRRVDPPPRGGVYRASASGLTSTHLTAQTPETIDPAIDAAEGEDGAFEIVEPAQHGAAGPTEREPANDGAVARQAEISREYPGWQDSPEEEAVGSPEADEPEDGVDGRSETATSGWEVAQESVFPQGAREPEALQESGSLPEDFEYDDGWGESPSGDFEPESAPGETWGRQAASSYGDEADEMEWDTTGLEYQALEETDNAAVETVELDVDQMIAIIEKVGSLETDNNGYSTFRSDPKRGLVYGIVGFDQASGNLGRLMTMMGERSPDAFRRIFGEASGEILRVTTSPDRASRLQPVAGNELDDEAWRAAFEAAGEEPQFQAAQRELAANLFIRPMTAFANWLGLDTRRAMTLIVDRAVALGVEAARRWIIDAVAPLGPAHLQQALAALDQGDVRTFQEAVGLEPTGDWNPVTKAALIGALRDLGDRSPVPVLALPQMLAAMQRAAADTDADRVGRILEDPSLSGLRYRLGAERRTGASQE